LKQFAVRIQSRFKKNPYSLDPVQSKSSPMLISATNCTVHTFPVTTQKLLSNLASVRSYQHQNAGIGVIACRIYHKIFAKKLPKKWDSIYVLQRKIFHWKKNKVQRSNYYFKANQLETKPDFSTLAEKVRPGNPGQSCDNQNRHFDT